MSKKMLTLQIATTWNQHLREDDRPMVWAFRAAKGGLLLVVVDLPPETTRLFSGKGGGLFSGSADTLLPVANWEVARDMLKPHEGDKDKVELAFFHKAELKSSVSTFVRGPDHSFDFPHSGARFSRISTMGRKLRASTDLELMQLR